jgi:hypothetical protein
VAGAFDVWVYRTREQSLPGVGGTVDQNGLLVHEIVEGSILPGGSLFLEMDWEIEWGKHELYVVVDKPIPSGEDSTLDPLRGDVLEQNETNNAASLNSSLAEYIDLRPWIQIEDIDNEDDVVKDDTIVITVTIYNNDSHNAVATYGEAEDDVDMYIRCKAGGDFLKPKTGSGSAYSGYKVNEELEPGDELEIEFEWKVQDDEGTDVRIKAYIDYHQNKNPENTLKVEMKVKRISYGPPRHSYFPWGSYILCGAFWLASMGLAAFFSKESRCMRCPGLKQRNRSLRYPKGTRKKGNRLSSKNKKQTRKPWTAPELRIREMGSPPQEEHQEPRPGSLLKNEH